MNNPKVIYLQPFCPDCYEEGKEYFDHDGRQWCEDDVWAEAICEDCGKEMMVPVYKLLEYRKTK